MSAAREVDVEQQLRLAAATAAWPATPDLRAGVLARIAAAAASPAGSASPVPCRPPARPGCDRSPRWRWRCSPSSPSSASPRASGSASRASTSCWSSGSHRLGRPRFERAGEGSSPSAASPPAPASASASARRSRVRRRSPSTGRGSSCRRRCRRPTPPTCIGAGDRRIVTLAWRAEPGQARLAVERPRADGDGRSGDGRRRADHEDRGARTRRSSPSSVNGDRGWWISGAPHELLIERPDGQVGSIPAAIAGDTLVFARDGTLYRLESSLGRDATAAIAEGLAW